MMFTRITPLIFLLFTLSFSAFSQVNKTDTDYSAVDSFVTTVKYKNDVAQLTQQLVAPYSGDLLKARAIFKWITDNIRYDYKFYNKYALKGKEPKTPECKDKEDCEAKKLLWETKLIEDALDNKKAVCAGYALLFKKMCALAGLKAEVVPGYVRTDYYQVGFAGTLDHAWNAVWIDGTCYLLDATWAAGNCWKDADEKLISFQKNFNPYYWLTPAADFARNHFPKEDKWVLMNNYTKENFKTNPYYASDIISNIKLILPVSGIVAAKKGDTIHFKFTYTGAFHNLQVNSNLFRNPNIYTEETERGENIRSLDTMALKKQRYVSYSRNNNEYDFEYVVTDNALYYVDILFDYRRVMRFKIVK